MSVAHVLRVHDQAPLLLLGAILRDGLREGPLAALALLEPPPELAHPLPDAAFLPLSPSNRSGASEPLRRICEAGGSPPCTIPPPRVARAGALSAPPRPGSGAAGSGALNLVARLASRSGPFLSSSLIFSCVLCSLCVGRRG